jgi:hypothetical protein
VTIALAFAIRTYLAPLPVLDGDASITALTRVLRWYWPVSVKPDHP